MLFFAFSLPRVLGVTALASPRHEAWLFNGKHQRRPNMLKISGSDNARVSYLRDPPRVEGEQFRLHMWWTRGTEIAT